MNQVPVLHNFFRISTPALLCAALDELDAFHNAAPLNQDDVI